MKQNSGFIKNVKKLCYTNAFLYKMMNMVEVAYRRIFKKGECIVENKGYARIKKDVQGKGNHVFVGEDSVLRNTSIYIRGNNNKIIFKKGCKVGADCSFWMEGNDISITIGAGTTFNHLVHFCAQENGVKIEVGEDCMFSNNVIVRTSDSHPIYNTESQQRINAPKDVIIGKHVWIAPNTKIMKGAIIGDGAIIGSDTMVSKSIPENSLAVGHPATVVKEHVEWTREKLF